MLQLSSDSPMLAPMGLSDNPADRRAHERIPSAKLPVTRVRIPNRPAVALVDLSSGGALLTLPFQVRPESRFALELNTPVEQVDVPFQLLRCYVATLQGEVTYHAAGAFDSLLNVHALAQRASSSVQRLIGTLERLRRGAQKTATQSRSDAAFAEMLGAVLHWLHRNESLDVVALQVNAHLTQTYPSLMILPSLLSARDELTSVSAFGLTFTSKHILSAHDRRFLRSSAQLLSMIEDIRREMRKEVEQAQPLQVVHSAADWMTATQRFATAGSHRA